MIKAVQFVFPALAAVCGNFVCLAQQDNRSAQEILQRAIDSEGGDHLLDSVNSMDLVQQVITPERDTLYRAIKRMGNDKYLVGVLSWTGENTTTIYNRGRAVVIRNELAQPIPDPLALEDFRQSCFSSRDYAYKKLGYRLTREPDEQIDHFDCYVLLAESPLGQKWLNYFDKQNGHLLMAIYGVNGTTHKTAFVEYYKQRGILIPRALLIADGNGATGFTRVTLSRIDDDSIIDSNWFHIPEAGICKPPDLFKTGSFICAQENGTFEVVRTMDRQTEIKKGVETDYHIEWTGDSDYLLFGMKPARTAAANRDIGNYKCRIINWSGNRCYCQCLGASQPEATVVIAKEN